MPLIVAITTELVWLCKSAPPLDQFATAGAGGDAGRHRGRWTDNLGEGGIQQILTMCAITGHLRLSLRVPMDLP